MFPDHAPFSASDRITIAAAVAGLNPLQRQWLSGWLAGATQLSANPALGAAPAGGPLLVIYGTESGNSEDLAARAVKAAKLRGHKAVMKNMAEISPEALAKGGDLLLIVSTWGDGDPPDSAVPFHKAVMAGGPELAGVRFSVCALGDTSYEKFCQTGRDFDERLERLGGERMFPREDCDTDYEEAFERWLEGALAAIGTSANVVSAMEPVLATVPTVEYGKKNPFPSELVEVVCLNGRGSSKETMHYEFDLNGSGLHYEPGDALAVLPLNSPASVKGILNAARLEGSETVDVKNVGRKVLADTLREDLDITQLSRAVLTKLAEAADSTRLRILLSEEKREELKDWMEARHIVDAIEEFAPHGIAADKLVGIFRKLPPRLYSIASSPLAHAGQVHLTIASVRYDSHGKLRNGVCSTYLADSVKPGDRVSLFVQPNKNFRLPADQSTPVIMVGPGTGVAPFRSFIAQRAALEAPGPSWLIFGDQHFTYDFLYQLEWQDYLKSGVLHRLDVAFSRDQPEKVYVQDRMLEHGAELFEWLEKGAHFYVCGDALRMAHDVHEALISVVSNHGAKSREEAEEYVENLKKVKRYQRDVY